MNYIRTPKPERYLKKVILNKINQSLKNKGIDNNIIKNSINKLRK